MTPRMSRVGSQVAELALRQGEMSGGVAMKRVSIHQPHYLPWLGLCDKIFKSDAFVLLDHVQFMSRGFQHRTLYSNQGKPSYLTLSVDDKGCQQNGTPIRDIKLKSPAVVLQKHIDALCSRYRKAENYPLLEQLIEEVLMKPWEDLSELAEATMIFTLTTFEARPEWARSSSLPVTSSKSALMLDLTRAMNGVEYLSGRGAESYMDDLGFPENGIALTYQNFSHPSYPQQSKQEFVSGCFALELAITDKGYLDTLRTFYRNTDQLTELRCVAWR